MKKLLIATAAVTLMGAPAVAHTTRHHHASGQGGCGPGSDHGGTSVAPGTMK